MAVGVPGEIAGYWEMHQKFGNLPWSDLFQPTIDLCRKGMPMSSGLKGAIWWVQKSGLKDSKLR